MNTQPITSTESQSGEVSSPPQRRTMGVLDAAVALKALRGFISPLQLQAIGNGVRSDDRQFFIEKLCELAARVTAMPKTYAQEGLGGAALAHLHYFTGGGDWYITEKDMESEQHQATGLVDLGFGSEFGYISIVELIENNVELDLHFTPKPLKEIDAEFYRNNSNGPSM